MTARINSGQGALGKFLNDEAMGRSLSGTMTNLETGDEAPERGRGHDRQAAHREGAVRPAQSDDRADRRRRPGPESGEGTAGQLLHDRQLYENMNRAVTELGDLLADIRKDPKKFLRVSVSIF